MRYELFLSFRYLVSKQKEGFISLISIISILGVAIGVMALIVVIAVMSGFDADLQEKIVGTNSHVLVEREGGLPDAEPVIRRVTALPHVVAASPYLNGQAILRVERVVQGVVLRGIDPAREVKVTRLGGYLAKGSGPLGDGEVWVGSELAKKFGLVIGDKVSIVSAGLKTPEELRIKGIFTSGMYEFDSTLVYTNIATAQKIYAYGTSVMGVGIRVDRAERAIAVRDEIRKALGPPYWVMGWTDMNKNLLSALQLEKTVMFVILALIIGVACFNIASTLIMVVLEKTKDIGILKSIGVPSSSIMAIFSLQGILIGFFGTAFGGAAGVGLCYLLKTYPIIKLPADIYYIDRLPVLVQWADAGVIMGAAMALSLVSTIYPAIEAARLNPVDALRYE